MDLYKFIKFFMSFKMGPAWNAFLGYVFVLLAGVGFGFLGIFGRLAYQSGLNIGELLTFRFTLATVILFIGLLVFNPKLIRVSFKQIFISAALGVFGYAVFSTLYFKSIEGLSVPLAALLLFTFPIFVNLGAHFILQEKLSRKQTTSLVIACIGLGILLWGPLVANSLSSVVYALVAALSYSIYVLVSGRYQQNIQPLSASLYVMASAGLALYLFHQPDFAKLLELSAPQIYIIFGIALVSTIGPLTLFLAGLQRLSSSKASIAVMIEPVVATLAAGTLLNETLTGLQLFGAALVMIALVLNALK